MTIEVNPTPDTSPEDQEVLRRVYQSQMDVYAEQHHEAATRVQDLRRQLEPLEAELHEAGSEADRLVGRMDELRRIAARDGITLD